MNSLYRLAATSLLLLTAVVCAQANPQGGEDATLSFRYSWSAPGYPALLSYPLPEDLDAEGLVDVRIEGGVVESFGYSHEPRQLDLSFVPNGQTSAFREIALVLDGGREVPLAVPSTQVDSIGAQEDLALGMRRMTTFSGSAFALAAVLGNDGEEPLQLQAARFLPADLEPGSLLVAATTEPDRLVDLVTETLGFSAPNPSADDAASGAAGPVAGFVWRPAADLDLSLAPGESAVLVWPLVAFGPNQAVVDYAFSPVIAYRQAPDGDLLEKGLPGVPQGRLGGPF